MTIEVSWLVRCNVTRCTATHPGQRPEATSAGWICDSPRGLDFCPRHHEHAPRLRPRGRCGFCGKAMSVSKTGLPTQHTTEYGMRCPGSYMPAKPESENR